MTIPLHSRERLVWTVSPRGGLGNRMIQYMVALYAARTLNFEISNVIIPEWGIDIPRMDAAGPELIISPRTNPHHVDWRRIQALLEANELHHVIFDSYGQRMGNFLPLDAYRQAFPSPAGLKVEGYGDEYIVCNIRGAEVLRAVHPHYTLLPTDFYEEVIQSTGLKPVFIGQLGNDEYTQELRHRFPNAIFRPSSGPLVDFETIRNSANLIPAISTFSWLAAWLSHAHRVYFPVSGLFNPRQAPLIDLLPTSDPRFIFYLFPLNFSEAVPFHRHAHSQLRGMWRMLPATLLRALVTGPPRFARRVNDYLNVFDEAYYLSQYPEVAEAVIRGTESSGVDHYVRIGFGQNRRCFRLDQKYYISRWPIAAFEVSQGDCIDLAHHYVAIGRHRGYRRTLSEFPLQPTLN